MKRNIDKFHQAEFDIVIIGGGITGACLAHDSALRGMRVALLEKDDFGMSTSSASSKLLHGGIRYLQKLQFGKVRESARERMYFQNIAPHITSYIPFLIPTISGNIMKGKFALMVGMTLYRLMCFGLNDVVKDSIKKVAKGKLFGKKGVIKQVPILDTIHGITGGHTLYESHMYNSERMTLAFIKTAVDNGAVVANHCEVVDFTQEGDRVAGVIGLDKLTKKRFPVSGKIIVNAAGPFLPTLNSKIPGLKLQKNTTGFSKGVHLVTHQLDDTFALALSSAKKTEGLVTRGGRHIFIIPWRNHSLIGTTNVPYAEKPEDTHVTEKDVNDFLQDINAIIPGLSLKKSDIKYAFAGLYPLVSEEIKTDTYQGTGEYQVVDHADQDNIEGIISVLGAKYTTARILAEYATDIVEKKLYSKKQKCKTATEPLSEGKIENLEAFIKEKKLEYKNLFDEETIEYLIASHGSNIDTVVEFLNTSKEYRNKISPHRETLVGEIAYAVEHEMACTLDDVIIARTGMGTIGHPGDAVLEKTVSLMGKLLCWSEEDCQKEMQQVNKRYQYL